MEVESSVSTPNPDWVTMLTSRTTWGVVEESDLGVRWGSSSETKNYGGTQEVTVEEMLMGRGTQEVTVEEGLEVMGEGLDEVSGRGLVWAGHGVGGTWCGRDMVWAWLVWVGHGVGVA